MVYQGTAISHTEYGWFIKGRPYHTVSTDGLTRDCQITHWVRMVYQGTVRSHTEYGWFIKGLSDHTLSTDGLTRDCHITQ